MSPLIYEDTAKLATDTGAQQLFLMLAEEENRHLDRLETVYDQKIQSEN